MCLVNCATKNMDIIQTAALMAETEIEGEKEEEECSDQCLTRATESSSEESETLKPDFIAIGTQWTRRSFQRMKRRWMKMQNSTFMRILTRTSQPLHVVAVIVTGIIMYSMYNPATDTSSSSSSSTPISCEKHHHQQTSPQSTAESLSSSPATATATNKLALFGYLSTFAIQFGSQIWMTFVSGLALYFSLPRHTFGQCQRVLFPKYFLMNASLGLVKLYSFCHMLEGRERIGTAAYVQMVLIAAATLIEAAIYLHYVDPLLNLMHLKHKYELMVGSGQEVGFENLRALKESVVYKKVHKAFRRTHMIIAMGNLATVACSFSHLYFMIQKIQMA